MLNILGEDGGIAPIAPGPIDYSRGRGRSRVSVNRTNQPIRSYSEQPKKTPPSSPESSPKASSRAHEGV